MVFAVREPVDNQPLAGLPQSTEICAVAPGNAQKWRQFRSASMSSACKSIGGVQNALTKPR